jgi:putative oxygen-independent coproporphyrinogen III oxidase
MVAMCSAYPRRVPSALPDGDPAPGDGALPESAARRLGTTPFGVYVHVPFCRTRCGYCDFNTYTHAELGGGASRQAYPATLRAEIALARRVLGGGEPGGPAGGALAGGRGGPPRPARGAPVHTVFFGGGTPTLLPPAEIGGVIAAIDEAFGLAPGAEVTVEANPESVDERSLGELRAAGVSRISVGMQSDVEHVLAILDRQHQPGRAQQCAAWARQAGFDHVSLDLIYGTPGESDDDWRRSLEAALSAGPDHVSAYALIVEEGTRLAGKVRRGEIAAPDDDVLADRYLIADEMLTGAGLRWYEISNWAAGDGARCRHNMAYWTGGDWWGFGPGAHSHVGGARWWNVRHPSAYAARLAAGQSPAAAREVLGPGEQALETVMLGIRLSDGLPAAELSPPARRRAAGYVADGHLDASGWASGRVVLTRSGRLLADAITRDLT